MVQGSVTLDDILGHPQTWEDPHNVCKRHANAYMVKDRVMWVDGGFWYIPDHSVDGSTYYDYERAYQVRPKTTITWERV
jgi:hypothetical protein